MGNYNYIYQENVKMFRKLYKQDFFLQLDKYKKKGIINVLYEDPDKEDRLLKKKAKKYSEKYGNIVFSPDGICGWKILFDVYSGEEGTKTQWIDHYEIIRGSIYGEMYWPLEKNKATINQQRGLKLGDRIDWTLLEIKNYLENSKSKKLSIDPDSNTKEFFSKIGSFPEFCDSLNFRNVFVDEKYNILDIASGSELDEKIEMRWYNRWGDQTKAENMKQYLDNLVNMLKEKEKK